MAKIIIDARLYGPKHTGIGRYVQNLISKIAITNSKHSITLLIDQSDLSPIRAKYGNLFKYLPTNISHYSLKEQLLLPFILYKNQPDLVHFTHFNKPILYFGKSVITIHDLIKNFYYGKNTTTRVGITYWPKYCFYRIFTWINIKSNFIIVPSNTWRKQLLTNYHLKPQNIITTYEAVDEFFRTPLTITSPKNYVIYTGNLYPHKNINVLLEALVQNPSINLKIISKKNIFYERTLKYVNQLKLGNRVQFLGHLDDSKFKLLYSRAIALVHPSLMEGFSLTGLEAMALNCPVISSSNSCMPEIYGKASLFFDPKDSQSLIKLIIKLQNNYKLREKLIKLGHSHYLKYSWNKTAAQTLSFYDDILQR